MKEKKKQLIQITVEYCLTKMLNANSDNERNFWERHLEYTIEFERKVSLDKQLRKLMILEYKYLNTEHPDFYVPLELLRIQEQIRTIKKLI